MLALLLDAFVLRRDRGPFEHHLREAIALNRERAPLYDALTGGASRRISFGLIAAEVLLLPMARWYDSAAAPYHQAGIPLLEALFVPMTDVPPFLAHRPCPAGATATPPPAASAARRRVEGAFREQSFAGAATALRAELVLWSAAPEMDALVRHLLESALRLALLAPGFIARSREHGLPSPEPMLTRLLRMHLWGLVTSSLLDRWARPLQQRGVAIISQDVPPIPVPAMDSVRLGRHPALTD